MDIEGGLSKGGLGQFTDLRGQFTDLRTWQERGVCF